MSIPSFSFDYTFLDIPGLANQCITTNEIESVFYDPASFYADWHRTDNIGYMIGYSLKNKFLSFTFELVGDGSTVRLVDVFLSNELEIAIMDTDQNLDRPLPNGTTRRQILEKLMNDTTPGLRGDDKWKAIERLQRERLQPKRTK